MIIPLILQAFIPSISSSNAQIDKNPHVWEQLCL